MVVQVVPDQVCRLLLLLLLSSEQVNASSYTQSTSTMQWQGTNFQRCSDCLSKLSASRCNAVMSTERSCRWPQVLVNGVAGTFDPPSFLAGCMSPPEPAAVGAAIGTLTMLGAGSELYGAVV